MGGVNRSRRNSFNAGLIIIILDVFSYANDWQDAGTTVLWGCVGLFWLAFSTHKPNGPKEQRNAVARRAFYRQYFGPVAPAAPFVPYLLLLAAYLVMTFLPSARWLVWTLLGVTALYVTAFLTLLSRFLRRWRRDLSAHAPEIREPWDGADGVL